MCGPGCSLRETSANPARQAPRNEEGLPAFAVAAPATDVADILARAEQDTAEALDAAGDKEGHGKKGGKRRKGRKGGKRGRKGKKGGRKGKGGKKHHHDDRDLSAVDELAADDEFDVADFDDEFDVADFDGEFDVAEVDEAEVTLESRDVAAAEAELETQGDHPKGDKHGTREPLLTNAHQFPSSPPAPAPRRRQRLTVRRQEGPQGP